MMHTHTHTIGFLFAPSQLPVISHSPTLVPSHMPINTSAPCFRFARVGSHKLTAHTKQFCLTNCPLTNQLPNTITHLTRRASLHSSMHASPLKDSYHKCLRCKRHFKSARQIRGTFDRFVADYTVPWCQTSGGHNSRLWGIL